MSMKLNLPKGCSSTQGVSHVRTIGSRSSHLTQQANRIYMLTVQRQGLVNKVNTWEAKLQEARGLLKAVDAGLRETQRTYGRLGGKTLRAGVLARERAPTEAAKAKRVTLKY